jgi:uncharacterized repeat protein (TIGR03803 family)
MRFLRPAKLCIASATLLLCASAHAFLFESIHQFSTNGIGPKNPTAPLIQASDGNFYGTTIAGGVNNAGTIFRLSPANALSVLHSFTGSKGSNAFGGLIEADDGVLYGTTAFGGTSNYGTIFKITTNGTFATIYSFSGDYDGAYPHGELLRGSDGNLYGTTTEGGTNNLGTVFKMTTTGSLIWTRSLTGQNGSYPYGGLVQGTDGNFYGVANQGGFQDYGAAFVATANGVVTLIDSFFGEGRSPHGKLAEGDDGSFYGTASRGGFYSDAGAIVKVTPNANVTRVVSFNYPNTGSHPAAGLVKSRDGYFYGTVVFDPTYGEGGVFSVTTNGTIKLVFQFNGANGENPQAPLMESREGDLYGTTYSGGTNGAGTVFVLRRERLYVNRSGSNISIQWPTWATNFVLQQTTNFLISNSWTTVSGALTTNQDSISITLPANLRAQFFRLKK